MRRLVVMAVALAALLAATSPAQAGSWRSCEEVTIVPNSGWGIFGIKARGISCAAARKELKRSKGSLERRGWAVVEKDPAVDECGSGRYSATRGRGAVRYTLSAC